MVPSEVANRLHASPDRAGGCAGEEQLASSEECNRSSFECTFKPRRWAAVVDRGAGAGGPRVPNHKKAEVEMQAAKCVANCSLLASRQ